MGGAAPPAPEGLGIVERRSRLAALGARRAAAPRRGAALLLSVLVLFVVITIVIQISISTITDARVARNMVGLTTMEQAIESVLLQVYEDLLADMEADGGGMPGGDAGGAMPGAMGGSGGGEEAPPPPYDSKMDEWAVPARTEINGIEMRIMIQDEDSKYNVLNLAHPDDRKAEEALRRVTRILDLMREDTDWDLSSAEAESIARAMQDHLRQRTRSGRERPEQLSYDPDRRDIGLPFTLREFESLEGLHPWLFREFRDESDRVVHSLGAYLTVHTSLQLGPAGAAEGQGAAGAAGVAGGAGGAGAGGEQAGGAEGAGQLPGATGQGSGQGARQGSGQAGGQGGGQGARPGSGPGAGELDFSGGGADGWGVNVNTAPAAVLKGLHDDRDVPYRFWDEVIEFRNLEVERDPHDDDDLAGLLVDEYGNELIERRVFDTLERLNEVRAFGDLHPEEQQRVLEFLTTRSQVFSIYVTARRSTAAQEGFGGLLTPEDRRAEEESGVHLVRTVRSVVWRTEGPQGGRIVPLVRWEVLDYVPYEVLDDPRSRR